VKVTHLPASPVRPPAPIRQSEPVRPVLAGCAW
jgi:hypothetical protein